MQLYRTVLIDVDEERVWGLCYYNKWWLVDSWQSLTCDINDEMMIEIVSMLTYYGCCLYQLNVTDEAYCRIIMSMFKS
jgi:hypothetical protein